MKSPLLIVGILLTLLLAGAAVAPFFVDWSRYRAEIEEYGRNLTGRDVRIIGGIDIRLLPQPTLTLENVSVANVENAASPVFVSVKTLRARMWPAPLLRGRVHVHSVILDRPEIHIERLAAGEGNWRLAPLARPAGTGFVSGVSLKEIRLVDGAVHVRTRGGIGNVDLDRVNLEISANSLNGPFHARGSVFHRDEPLEVSVSTGKYRDDGSMRLNVRVQPQAGNRLQYGFDGKLLGETSPEFASGTIRITPPEISETGKSAPLSDVEKLPFLFTSGMTIGEDRLSFGKIELALDRSAAVTNAVTGNAEFTFGYDTGFSVDLSTRHLDLDALAGHLGARATRKLKSAVSLGALDAVAALLPENAHGRVRLNADRMKAGAAVVEEGKLDVRVTDTGIKVRELSSLLPGRTRFGFSGLYLLDPVTPQFNGDFSFDALDGRGFLNWIRPGLYGKEAGRVGRLKFAGSLSTTPEHGRIGDASFEFDGGTGRGSLFWTRSGSPFIKAEIFSDDLDVAAIMPRGRKSGLLEGPTFVRRLLDADGATVGLNMRIGRLAFASQTLKEFLVEARFGELDMDIRRLAATVGEEGRIDLSGSFTDENQAAKSGVSGRINAPDAGEMLQVLGVRDASPRLRELLAGEPLDVRLEYVSGSRNTRLSVEGLAGGGSGGLVVEVGGPPAEWRKANLRVDGTFETARAHHLLTSLGVASGEFASVEKADASIDVQASGALPSGVSATVRGETLGASMEVSTVLRDSESGLHVDGILQASASAASGISAVLGGGVPIDGEARISGRFAGDRRSYLLSGVELSLPGVRGAFEGSLFPRDGKTHLAGSARFERLDLGSALGALTLGPPLENIPDFSFWTDRPFRVDVLRGLSFDIGTSAANMVLAPDATVADAAFDLAGSDGEINLTNGSGRLFGGLLQAAASLENTPDGSLEFKANLDLDDARLSEFMRDGQDNALLRGIVSLAGDFKGRGRSPGGVVSVLRGEGEWSLEGTRLSGTDPEGFVKSLDRVADAVGLDDLISSSLHDGAWSFDAVRSKWTARGGLIELSPGELNSPFANGRVGASVDVVAGALNAVWNVKISGLQDAPHYQVEITGPFGALSRVHDTADLRSFLMVKALREGVSELEESLRAQERP